MIQVVLPDDAQKCHNGYNESSVMKSNECFVWDFSGNLGCIHHFTHRMELMMMTQVVFEGPLI